MKREYKVIAYNIHSWDFEQLERELNKFGGGEWRVIHVSEILRNKDGLEAILVWFELET